MARVFPRPGCHWIMLTLLLAISRPAFGAPPDRVEGAAINGTLGLTSDATLRYTVAVLVNGRGPYRFVIDTGADRSSISSRVAAALMLPAGPPLKVHSMSGVSQVASAKIQTLEVMPGIVLADLIAPVFSGDNLGADGLLGVDSLQGHQVVIDFAKQTMVVRTAVKHELPTIDDDGAVIVRARSKYGQLILVDSSLGARSLRVVLDTGAQYAVGNLAMRRLADRLIDHENGSRQVQMLSVVGKSVIADYTQIGQIKLGGFILLNTPIAFADAHPFKRFGLDRQPAMLLGMDMLHLFRRVTIDFANRQVSFVAPPGMRFDTDVPKPPRKS